MPALKNQLHEKIALLYPGCTAKGMTQAEIYQMAGGKAGSRQSAEVLASRTLNRPDVLARIAELGAPAAKKAEADAEHFMQKFETVFQGAAKVGQFGHANRAGELQARISGVLVDRSEIKADVHVDDLRDATDIQAEIVKRYGEMVAFAFEDFVVRQACEKTGEEFPTMAQSLASWMIDQRKMPLKHALRFCNELRDEIKKVAPDPLSPLSPVKQWEGRKPHWQRVQEREEREERKRQRALLANPD
jgi:phage terminase small subunit